MKKRNNPESTELKIIKRLQELTKKLEKTPTRREYLAEYGNPEFKNYGGYNTMLVKAGLKVNMHIKLTDDEIKKRFVEYIEKNGVPISKKIPKELPSYDLICSRFGSYKSFLQSIGYDTLLNYWDRDKIIKTLQKGIDSGDIKSSEDLNKKGYPTLTTIREILKVSTWKQALKIADRELISTHRSHGKYNFTKEELKNKYVELSKKIGKSRRGASRIDIRQELGFSVIVFERAFKKRFSDLKKEWGYDVRKSTAYTQEEIFEILISKINKKGSYLTLREITVDKDLPTLTTFYRVFRTGSMKEVYEKLEKYKRKNNRG